MKIFGSRIHAFLSRWNRQIQWLSASISHQNYAENNAVKYNFYRFSCGRDLRLDSVWGDNARSGNAWVK